MHFLKIWKVISPFLNFDSSTGDFLKNAKIALVLLIGPFLIRTDCVYKLTCNFHFSLSRSATIGAICLEIEHLFYEVEAVLSDWLLLFI